MPDTLCTKTTVRSLLNYEHSFGFLGFHGRRLGAFEQYTEPGDLVQKLAQQNLRKYNALMRAISDARIAVIKTPAPIIQDGTTGDAKQITSTGGTLAVADPCWAAFLGSLRGSWDAIADSGATVASAVITFSAPLLTPITVANLVLTRDATPLTISAFTVTPDVTNRIFTVANMAGQTATNGTYIIRVEADTMTAIQDIYGNTGIAADISEQWIKS
jgi:hypothetical protein